MSQHAAILRLPVVASTDYLPLAESATKRQIVRMKGRPKRTEADRALMAAMGMRLRWVRDALDLRQHQIAEAVGIDQTTWSLYELGKRWPDQFAAARLIAKLKISHAYLLEGSLEGVERELAIQLAARHPELAAPINTEPRKDRLLA
ncbi:MAG TPA: helix-turn-helix transcriptional regulator [Xanthobacteraceae bacterium]